MEHTVEKVQLKGGCEGLLVNVQGAKVVTTEIFFNSGFLLSDPKKYEMPHITEHLLVAGNENYPNSLEYKQQLEKNGAAFNAYTNSDYNWYYWECASFEIERIYQLATSQLGKPLIGEEDVEREKSRVISEHEGNMSSHSRTAWNNLVVQSYKEPSYAERLNQLSSITADDMRAYYERTHTQENARFIVAGDIDENREAILAGLNAIITTLPSGEALTQPVRSATTPDKPAREHREIADVFYVMNFTTEPLSRAELPVASLLQGIFNSYSKSSLFGMVWEAGLAYGIGSGYNYSSYDSGFSIGRSVSPKNIEPLFELIAKQVNRVLDGKVPKKDLEEAKKRGEGRLDVALQTSSSLANFYTDEYLVFGELMSLEEWLDARRAVTVEQLQAVAQKLFRSGEWAMSLVGPVDEAEAHKLYKIIEQVRS